MLTSLTDVDGYRVNYEYYTSSPYRVKRITEFGGNVKGNSLTLTYGYNSTKFTDNKKKEAKSIALTTAETFCTFMTALAMLQAHDSIPAEIM